MKLDEWSQLRERKGRDRDKKVRKIMKSKVFLEGM